MQNLLQVPCGSRVLNIFINLPRPAGLMLSKDSSIGKGCYAFQWLDNVDMHTYAKYDQNLPCGSIVKTFSLTANGQADRRTHTVIIVHTCGEKLCIHTRGSKKFCQRESNFDNLFFS